MRVPLSWLREYVDFDLEPEALAERLTLLGMEVKGIERRGAAWRSVVVGELLEVAPHPGSSRLSLTRVATGDGAAPLSIVCGATNIAVGQRVPVALPGAVLPGERRIEVTTIAGTESQGMLCSGDELGLTPDAEGILILPGPTPLGRPLADLYGDVVLDVDVKPNRGDALSMVGLAREVAAATGGSVRWPDTDPEEAGDATADHVGVEVRDDRLCPRFVARWIDGVAVGPSPLDVQLRLTAAGMRPVSNVVDASNYVMLELGKPIHTFDAAAVPGGRIVVRRAEPGERLETLDHVERVLDPETLLIAGTERPLGIAGVMGGATSEVGEGTTQVIVESAVFDPVSIRRTAQRYALRSEASARFEKGQEHRLARIGADRTAQLIGRWAGGRVAMGRVDTQPVEPAPSRVPFRPARVGRLLGVPVEADEIRELLARVEIETEPAQPEDAVVVGQSLPPVALGVAEAIDALVAVVPTHRRDVAIEADVVEEIVRVRGYETVAGRLPDTPSPPYRPDPLRLVDTVRDLLAGRGLDEVVTPALIGPEDHLALGLPADDPDTIRIANPLSSDHSQMRRSLLPGLVRVLVDNERQRRGDVALFEIGPVHRVSDGRPQQELRLGIVMAGAAERRTWVAPGHLAELPDLAGLLTALLARLGAGLPTLEPVADAIAVEHPGRTAVLRVRGRGIGRLGELHPRYLAHLEVRATRVLHADLDAAALFALVPRRRSVEPVERVPVVERDLAVVTERSRPAGDVERVLRETAGELLRDLTLFDRYTGAPLAAEEVSLAYRLRLQARGRTLHDAEVDELIARVVAALGERLGARIRS